MLVLNPNLVEFAGATWREVRSVAIDREARREVVEWSDFGPHAVFADVTRCLVRVRVVVAGDGAFEESVRPGREGVLTFVASPVAADARRRRVSITCVLVSATHDLRRGWTRTLEFVALSADGEADPVRVEAEGGLP